MRIKLLSLALVASACGPETSVKPGTPTGPALVSALQGAWCFSDDDGKSCWGWDVFVDSETIEACGRFPKDGNAFRARAKFRVEGTKACYEVVESNHLKAFPVGLKVCATVLEINDKYQRYRISGPIETAYRAPLSAVKCPSDA